MKQATFKIWQQTLEKLRQLYASSGVPMVRILDRLVSEELEKTNAKSPQNKTQTK